MRRLLLTAIGRCTYRLSVSSLEFFLLPIRTLRVGLIQALAAMNTLRRLSVLVPLLLMNAPALACSWPYYTPQEKYKTHSVAVLAYPISIVSKPTNALEPAFRGTFQQTIHWQVLVSWKGPHRLGDILLTRVSYQTSKVCGDDSQRDRSVKLLYLSGREPYDVMVHSQPHLSIEDMKYLGQ